MRSGYDLIWCLSSTIFDAVTLFKFSTGSGHVGESFVGQERWDEWFYPRWRGESFIRHGGWCHPAKSHLCAHHWRSQVGFPMWLHHRQSVSRFGELNIFSQNNSVHSHASSSPLIPILISHNSWSCIYMLLLFSHRNVAVRKTTSQFLFALVDKMGPGRILSGIKDITDRVLPTAAHFITDGSPETR